MNERPGFVSTMGMLAAGILLLGVVVWTVVGGPVLFSPGALNAQAGASALGGVDSHSELSADCDACHSSPWSAETMADRCFGCHDVVAAEIKDREGIHATLIEAGASPTCGGCHPEHNGPEGALTVLDTTDFPHDVTGFSLETHERAADGADFTCEECHPDEYSPFEEAVCSDCHGAIDAAFMDRHEETWGSDCLPCHDGSGHDGVGFDHDATGFELTGGHAGVACVDCHAGAESAQDLRDTPRACYPCHEKDDEHESAYGRQCGECHSTADWDEVDFDHDVFPLDHGSEERTAGCETCHPDDTDSYTCYGCHEHTTAKVLDEHEGRSLDELKECVECHPRGEEAEEDDAGEDDD
jgi:hypothetical protein